MRGGARLSRGWACGLGATLPSDAPAPEACRDVTPPRGMGLSGRSQHATLRAPRRRRDEGDVMQSARIATLLESRPVGERVLVNGWVRTRRDSKGGFSFIELNDGSCLANLQVLAEAALPNYK